LVRGEPWGGTKVWTLSQIPYENNHAPLLAAGLVDFKRKADRLNAMFNRFLEAGFTGPRVLTNRILKLVQGVKNGGIWV
jgi:hypothetical protein